MPRCENRRPGSCAGFGTERSAPRFRRGSIDPAVAPFPIGLAQFAPQDLSREVARDGVDEIDRLRRLEIRDSAPRPGDDVGSVRGSPRFQDDDRFPRLAPYVVGDADPGRVGYRWMTEERVLHL